jgi:hypothetical protein
MREGEARRFRGRARAQEADLLRSRVIFRVTGSQWVPITPMPAA